MNANNITLALLRDNYQVHFSIPRYTPKDWWEMDVTVITASGFMREYEIKTSRADFKADAFKEREYGKLWQGGERPLTDSDKRNKHEMLAAGDPRGPVQFWFACPSMLLTVEDVPEWAGLIWAYESDVYGVRTVHLKEMKPARRLHTWKANPEILPNAKAACYYRMHNEMQRNARCTSAPTTTTALPT